MNVRIWYDILLLIQYHKEIAKTPLQTNKYENLKKRLKQLCIDIKFAMIRNVQKMYLAE